jgi:hypothetical protein
MSRIFACLAIGQFIVFLGTATLGWTHVVGSPNRHVVLGVFSLLLSCMIQVVVFTYFTVTGKMIAQAMHLAKLDRRLLDDVKRWKRSVTRLLACGMASVLFVTVTGALYWRSGGAGGVHLLAAMLLLAVHLGVLYKEYDLIVCNAKLLDEVLGRFEHKKASHEFAADSHGGKSP